MGKLAWWGGGHRQPGSRAPQAGDGAQLHSSVSLTKGHLERQFVFAHVDVFIFGTPVVTVHHFLLQNVSSHVTVYVTVK